MTTGYRAKYLILKTEVKLMAENKSTDPKRIPLIEHRGQQEVAPARKPIPGPTPEKSDGSKSGNDKS